jgi:hypothetical protein
MISEILKPTVQVQNEERERISAPRQGISLESATETRAVYIRKAVSFLAEGFDKSKLPESFSAVFAPRWELDLGNGTDEHSLCSRAAWSMVCMWLLARVSDAINGSDGFVEAEEWFLGNIPLHAPYLSALVSTENLAKAKSSLLKVSIDQDFWDLFPYILQEVGPGSRAAVLRNLGNRAARAIKKHHGIFYTPSDVADYMVRSVLANCPADIAYAKCLDPACGTGVFLLALCREAEKQTNWKSFDCFEYVTTNLFGCDISSHAVDACAFVLLQHCLPDVERRGLSPWAAWHIIRLNLSNVDSLKLTTGLHFDAGTLREEQKQLLLSAEHWVEPKKQCLQNTQANLFAIQEMIKIGELFAEVKDGFNIIVGNPPYSRLGGRTDYDLLSQEYHSFTNRKAGPNDDIFLLFIEMMWRLTVPGHNISSLVTPLSIAYNKGTRFVNCRRAMSMHGGCLKFAFFDREPHALFGEEVKTRNAILFRIENISIPQRGETAIIETGPLIKWTSRTRQQLFNNIHFTYLDASNIAGGIPKVEGDLQAFVFEVLRGASGRFGKFCRSIGKCSLETALRQEHAEFVYVGGTAYNFLNVFRKFDIDANSKIPISESPIHCLEFITEKDASAAFAILSSRLVFWLWHIQSDGFHVPSWFIKELTLDANNISEEQMLLLSKLGSRLWANVQTHRFSSVNGGKLTYTFRPLSCNEERDEIDSILVEAFNLPSEFALELKRFERKIVVIDESDAKREHLKKYFAGGIKNA